MIEFVTRGAENGRVWNGTRMDEERRFIRSFFQSFVKLRETADSYTPGENELNFQQEGFGIDIRKYPQYECCEKNAETPSLKILRNNKDNHYLLVVA